MKSRFFSRLKAYYELTKPKTVWLLVLVGACAPFLLPHRSGDFWIRYLAGVFLLTLSVAGTNAFTCWIDRDIDSLMERTRGRPLPEGQISERAALLFSLTLFLLGVLGAVLLRPSSSVFLILGFVFSAVIYNGYLKRRTFLNIIFASPAGMMPILFMWSFVDGRITLLPVLLGLLVIFWTPAHIWSLALIYRDDYSRASIPMLPAVKDEATTIRAIAAANSGLVVVTLLLVLKGMFSAFFGFFASLLNAALIYLTVKAGLNPNRNNAYILFKFSSPYLAIIFLLAVLDRLFSSF